MKTSAQGFTGLHMLLSTSAFFCVVIAVNVTMAVYASSSWSGLVVENTYVASQEFNRKAAAMKAMATSGIKGTLFEQPQAEHGPARMSWLEAVRHFSPSRQLYMRKFDSPEKRWREKNPTPFVLP